MKSFSLSVSHWPCSALVGHRLPHLSCCAASSDWGDCLFCLCTANALSGPRGPVRLRHCRIRVFPSLQGKQGVISWACDVSLVHRYMKWITSSFALLLLHNNSNVKVGGWCGRLTGCAIWASGGVTQPAVSDDLAHAHTLCIYLLVEMPLEEQYSCSHLEMACLWLYRPHPQVEYKRWTLAEEQTMGSWPLYALHAQRITKQVYIQFMYMTTLSEYSEYSCNSNSHARNCVWPSLCSTPKQELALLVTKTSTSYSAVPKLLKV